MQTSLVRPSVRQGLPYTGKWFGVTASGTGIYPSPAGYIGFSIGWVEGLEINFFGAVSVSISGARRSSSPVSAGLG